MVSQKHVPASEGYGWAVMLMRAGFMGRALVYLAVAGVSAWAILTGGRASGTSGALSRIEHLAGGLPVLVLICLGMVAYALWRLAASFYDLERYGIDAKGIVARCGMVATGIVHLGIGAIAAKLLFNTGGGSSVAGIVAGVMDMPGGRIVIGIGGLIVLLTGAYYIYNGATRGYRRLLRANDTTQRIGPVLTFGTIANGAVVTAIGGLFVLAAIRRRPGDAGGLDEVFRWAYSTPFGSVVVLSICLGMGAFAIFCIVQAVWGIVPKAADHDIETLAGALGVGASKRAG